MYSVWWKRQGEWVRLYESWNPTYAKEYAEEKIHKGGITERIEIRDLTGSLETVYDRSWS